MMKILVLYFSRSGNTRRLAEAIAAGIDSVDGVEGVLRDPGEVTKEDFLDSEGIIAGSPVYFGGMAAQLKEVFDRFVGVRQKMGDKIGAAFATSGDLSGGKETTMFSIIQALMIYGMIIVGDPLDATGHYGVSCTGTPDEKTLTNARKLGKRVAALAKKLKA
ncbi:MAG: NAD(P)H-dependent oxidoreductase [Syntrophorhabdaceae bacterium]|nr:NAD(P)H-dependent oxidoreductase [Syntrophorhabdaceae bacterium]MDD4195040.1 NAD(P)H-dependent oxidoreductase [Syntrophorhabdaceae bacterium]HOC46330.1 NAD(P)H-dependent oxidoreductase [Syntrophorhabdaceae bacterium]